jgi:hypothetical protein
MCSRGRTAVPSYTIRDTLTGTERVCCERHFTESVVQDIEVLKALLHYLAEHQRRESEMKRKAC